MKARDQLKLDTIALVFQKKISLEDARSVLNVSVRTVERYLKSYRDKGPLFSIHGNTGRSPTNKSSEADVERALELMKEKYFDFNLTHALEKLAADEGIRINRETFRERCHGIGMVKRAQSRRKKVRSARERTAAEGIFLQMDGSPHRWFGGKESCLIAAIDDASSEVYGAEFFESETTLACMKVLRRIIEAKGLFRFLYVDRAGIFGGPKRVHFSQVKRALLELGIQIIFANSPEAKGRIERLWGTLQDRLIPEMRIRKIKSFESANDFLRDQYIPNDHNKRFMVLPKVLEPAWRELPSSKNLDEIFCMKERRTVKRDHTFSLDGQIYKITSELKHSIHGQKIESRVYPDGTRKFYFADREIAVEQHHVRPQIALAVATEVIRAEAESFLVRKDGHIEYKGNFYSVDPGFVGKHVVARERDGVILILYRSELIETHAKILKNGFQRASTKPEHLGPWTTAVGPGSVYRKAARRIGEHADRLVYIIIQRGQGVVDMRSIWGIVNLEKEYTRSSVDESCRIAIQIGECSYRTVRSILQTRYKKKVVGF